MYFSYFLTLFTKKRRAKKPYTTTSDAKKKTVLIQICAFVRFQKRGTRLRKRNTSWNLVRSSRGGTPRTCGGAPFSFVQPMFSKEKTRERIHLHAIEAVEFLARFFTAIRNRRRSCLVNLFFNVTCPKVNNTAGTREESAGRSPAYRPLSSKSVCTEFNRYYSAK